MSDWLPGAKEGKMRAEAVIRRRNSATALTTDLDLEMQDLQVSLELDGKDFQPADLADFKMAVERAQALMEQIYNDVTLVATKAVPERITEAQAYEYMQPALRIEARVAEVRKMIVKAQAARSQVGKPRDEAAAAIAEAERHRLQVEINLAAVQSILGQLKAVYAESYPKAEAAFLSASSEIKAATQMVVSARQALSRHSWREARDLATRSITIFDSASAKFDLIRISESDYMKASQDADEALKNGLNRLNQARTLLAAQASLLNIEPSHYLQPAVQRLGEARRAFKSTPPQYVTTLRLANQALSMIEEAISQVQNETNKIRQARLDAQRALELLNEAVQNLRIGINSQRSVPVRANELYSQSRTDRDRLLPRQAEIEKLNLPQLIELTVAAKLALASAEKGLRLLDT